MTISTKHRFQTTIVEAPPPGGVGTSEWNDTHATTGTPGTLFGFDANGNPVEIALGANLQIVNGILQVTGLAVVATSGKASDLTNDAGFVNVAQAAAAAPVQSINGHVGAVTITETATLSVGP